MPSPLLSSCTALHAWVTKRDSCIPHATITTAMCKWTAAAWQHAWPAKQSASASAEECAADPVGVGLDAVIPVQAESPTDYVRFSTDYGNCWHRIDLPKALDVQNIRSALWNNWALMRHGVTSGTCQSPFHVRCFIQGL